MDHANSEPTSHLRPSEAIVRAFLQTVPDPIFRMSRDGTYLDYSAHPDATLLAPPFTSLFTAGEKAVDEFV